MKMRKETQVYPYKTLEEAFMEKISSGATTSEEDGGETNPLFPLARVMVIES